MCASLGPSARCTRSGLVATSRCAGPPGWANWIGFRIVVQNSGIRCSLSLCSIFRRVWNLRAGVGVAGGMAFRDQRRRAGSATFFPARRLRLSPHKSRKGPSLAVCRSSPVSAIWLSVEKAMALRLNEHRGDHPHGNIWEKKRTRDRVRRHLSTMRPISQSDLVHREIVGWPPRRSKSGGQPRSPLLERLAGSAAHSFDEPRPGANRFPQAQHRIGNTPTWHGPGQSEDDVVGPRSP